MILPGQLISIGRYNKPHGVHGEISATLDVDIALLERFKCLISEVDGIYVPFFVEASRPKNGQTTLLSIEGMDDEKSVAMLAGKQIYVDKTSFAHVADQENADAYPLDFFVGFVVHDTDGATVGTVKGVNDTTANVLFEVERPDGQQVWLPAAEDLIVDLNVDEKLITMDLPEGILEL